MLHRGERRSPDDTIRGEPTMDDSILTGDRRMNTTTKTTTTTRIQCGSKSVCPLPRINAKRTQSSVGQGTKLTPTQSKLDR